MTYRQTLTIIASIRKGREESLRALLNAEGDAMQSPDSSHPLGQIETIHFARWVIVDGIERKAGTVPSRLVFCSNYDGPLDSQLSALTSKLGPLLDEVFYSCEGYPDSERRTDASRIRYLSDHIVANEAIFIGAPDRTLTQIRQENDLRIALRRHLDGLRTSGMTASEVVQALRELVLSDEHLSWARQPPPPRESTWLQMSALVIAALPLLPFAASWLLILRLFFERKDRPFDLQASQLCPRAG